MPKAIRMPSFDELPKGPRRDFVEELFEYFRIARRPALRTVSERISAHDQLTGTASRETIRRMLNGTGVPARWDTVQAVFLVLCELGGQDPNAQRWEGYYSNDDDAPASRQDHMEKLWNNALDDVRPLLASPSDEPPF